MRPYRFQAVLSILALLVMACGTEATQEPGSPPQAGEPGTNAFARLGRLDATALHTAFRNLDRVPHLRRVETEQLEDNALLARREYLLRVQPGQDAPTVVEVDSMGAFQFGFLAPFVSSTPTFTTRPDLQALIVPEDPPYLDPRNHDAFLYDVGPDTVLWGTPVQRISVVAAPGEGDDQAIRRAHLFVDATNRLIAYRVMRQNEALFFKEESEGFVAIRPMQDSTWVPAAVRTDTRLRVPFRGHQHFRSRTHFEITP